MAEKEEDASPDDLPTLEDMLGDAKERQARYESSKPRYADPATVSKIAVIPFKALSLREVLFQRFVHLNSTVLSLVDSGKWVPALALLRCSIESTALICQLDKEIEECLRTGKIDKAHAFLVKALRGSTGKGAEVTPANIQSAINFLDQKYGTFKQAYESLNGYVHPNFEGLLAAYANWDEKHLLLHLGPQDIVGKEQNIACLLMCMSAFEGIYNGLPDKLIKFSSQCEERISRKEDEVEEK